MKKLPYKILSTVISLVLVTTTLLGSGDFFFPKTEAHFTSPGSMPSTCTPGGSFVLPFFLGSGIGVTSVFSISSSTTLITGKTGGGSSPTLPSGAIDITLSSVSGTSVSITVACPATPSSSTLISHYHTQTSPPEAPTFPGSFSVTATAALNPPTVSVSPSSITIGHSDLGAPASNHIYTISADDGDPVTQTTTLALVGCPSGNWSITAPHTGTSPTTGPNGWTSTLTYTYPRTGPILNDPCSVSASDAQGTTTSNIVTFTATNAAPVVDATFGNCVGPGVNKPLGSLTTSDGACSAPGTLTLSDADDDTDIITNGTPPAGVTIVPPLLPSYPEAAHGMSIDVADNFTGGQVSFRGEDIHGAYSYDYVEIGPTGGDRRYVLDPVFVNRPPPSTPPEKPEGDPEKQFCTVTTYTETNTVVTEVQTISTEERSLGGFHYYTSDSIRENYDF